jgi:hypothetical protein
MHTHPPAKQKQTPFLSDKFCRVLSFFLRHRIQGFNALLNMKRSHFQDHQRILACLDAAVRSAGAHLSVDQTVIVAIKQDFENHTAKYDATYAHALPNAIHEHLSLSTAAPMACAAGVWTWKYRAGEFEVHVLEDGTFVCPSYPAEHSRWSLHAGGKVRVHWGKYGQYDMQMSSPAEMKGSLAGSAKDWRTAQFVREHTLAEKAAYSNQ